MRFVLWYTNKNFVDSRDRSGDTALHVAARKGNVTMVDLLLRHRADVNAISGLAKTTALIAMLNSYDFQPRYRQNEDKAIMLVLLSYGAQYDREDRNGRRLVQLLPEMGQ